MIYLKQNDFGVGRRATLSDENGPINLTDYEVRFSFNEHEIVPTIEDAANGKVLIVFDEIHTQETGIFNGEFKLTKTGSRESIPTDDYIKIYIVKEV